MPRPTMEQMREREAALKAERASKRKRKWLVEVDTRVTYKATVEVMAVEKEEAEMVALEEIECWGLFVGPGEYDECEFDEHDLRARPKRRGE